MLVPMTPISAMPAARRHRRWLLCGWAAVAVAVAGLGLLPLWPGLAAWIVLAGAVTAHWAGRQASDCGVLAQRAGLTLSQVAVVPARVRPRSSTPVADIARMRAAGCGVVSVAGVDRLLALERIDRYDIETLLTGQWAHLARVACELDGELPVDHLTRLPSEGEVWLVRTSVINLAVGAAQLRQGHRRVRRGRREPVGPVAPGADLRHRGRRRGEPVLRP
ncbi:MAG TPA: hypothetical protein VFZ70_15845 [Euzebyales bacterium]